MNTRYVRHSFLIFLILIQITNVSCLMRVDWDGSDKNVKRVPSPDAFPTAEEANLTQAERARLIKEGKRTSSGPEGMELVHGGSDFSYEKACTQLLSKCQGNCMEEWYPFTSIFLPIIGYRSAKQRQCMDRCDQFCNLPLPSRILSGETRTFPTNPGPQPQ